MSDAPALTLEELQSAVAGSAVALRLRARLQPAGGPGDKIYPPTYADSQDGGRHDIKYATETRLIDGAERPTVLIDSVASQANRMELALLAAARRGRIDIPVLEVDFSRSIPDLGSISTLEAPHRVYDAILRDSMFDGEPFRMSKVGQSITEASPRNARAMFQHCPTALLFGAWDSTGPKRGMGNKFQRALVSEIVGIDFRAGTSVGSRIDPLQISAAVPLSIPKDDPAGWEIGEGAKVKGRPSEVNHSNVPPTRNEGAGGVTFAYALHTAVLSLSALRRLGFGDWSEEACDAARTVVAALGVAALAHQQAAGYDLRSRCTLVPEEPPSLELVGADGSVRAFSVTSEAAATLLGEALANANALDVAWRGGVKALEPMDKLVQLVEKSREIMAAGRAED